MLVSAIFIKAYAYFILIFGVIFSCVVGIGFNAILNGKSDKRKD